MTREPICSCGHLRSKHGSRPAGPCFACVPKTNGSRPCRCTAFVAAERKRRLRTLTAEDAAYLAATEDA